jgi:hypothetical protein
MYTPSNLSTCPTVKNFAVHDYDFSGQRRGGPILAAWTSNSAQTYDSRGRVIGARGDND